MPTRSAACRRSGAVLAALAVALSAGCIHVFWKTDVRPLVPPAAVDTGYTRVRTPVKAHLIDGGTVVFRRGAIIGRGVLAGDGEAYALLSAVAVRRGAVPLDSIVGLETFEESVLAAPTFAASVAGTAAGTFATALLAVAIFGSCPTVYAESDAGPVLEAEGFSYALAPLLEHRDLDPLRVRARPDGTVRLELRNEALETHYINHVTLAAVRHPAGSLALPDQNGRPVVVGAVRPLHGAVDRAGRNVRADLAAADGRLFASDPRTVAGARVGDLDDWIDVVGDDLPPGDSVAVVLRLRNSLLNTVLLYEGMLGGRDAPDWLAGGLQRIAGAIDLSRWYVRTMGLRAAVHAAARPRAQPDDDPATSGLAAAGAGVDGTAPATTRLGDVGPIAFRDVALVLPRPTRDARRVGVRLRFVADNWRIDQVRVAGTIARPVAAALPVARVEVPTPAVGPGPVLDTAAVTALAEADAHYLQTRPGQRMVLVFGAPPATARDSTTTFLLSWQGWYSEWIRGAWLARPTRTTPFVPGDSAVLAALQRFTERRPTLEREFYQSQIPVR